MKSCPVCLLQRIRSGARVLLVFITLSVAGGRLHAQDPWAEQIAKLTAGDATHPPSKGCIVFTGSSSIRMWNQNLERDFPGLDTVGRGFGGSTIADGLRHLDRLVLPYEPRMVVFYAGENDIAAGRSPEQVAQDFAAYCDAVLKALPNARLLYVSIKPSPKRWHLREQYDRANALIAGHCARTFRAAFLDIRPAMLGADGQPRAELFTKDNLHMNADGYRLWRELIAPLLPPEALTAPVAGLSVPPS